jgi:hypothetical protein
MTTLSDGTILHTMSIKELIRIPVWEGNRTISREHVQHLRSCIGTRIHDLNPTFHIISYMEHDLDGNPVSVRNIVDGQHRIQLIQEYFATNLFAEDYVVAVIEKPIKTELEIHAYFKKINNVNPIRWKTDPKLLANAYIQALMSALGKTGARNICTQRCNRPRLHIETLRVVLESCALREDGMEAFAARAVAANAALLAQADVAILQYPVGHTEGNIISKGAKAGFMLGIDRKLRWVRECLES